MDVYRWDLDKTYLETDFDSVRGLLRAAIEPAEARRNVPGAAALLRALAARSASRVMILSGSPTQMRDRLARKLALDGVRFDELHLKDNLGNLRRGRLRAIRGQVGYKLPALLAGRRGLPPTAREWLFGDDAEADALVYSVYADALAGRLGPDELVRILEAGGAYPDAVALALDALAELPRADAVARIFIHLDRGRPPAAFAPLGGRVVPVHSWLQAALVLHEAGQLGPEEVGAVVVEVVAATRLGADGVANLVQDAARRGLVGRRSLAALIDAMPLDEPGVRPFVDACRRRLALAPLPAAPLPADPPTAPDYPALLRRSQRGAAERGSR